GGRRRGGDRREGGGRDRDGGRRGTAAEEAARNPDGSPVEGDRQGGPREPVHAGARRARGGHRGRLSPDAGPRSGRGDGRGRADRRGAGGRDGNVALSADV